MTRQGATAATQNEERNLFTSQCLRYAEDLATVYREQKSLRLELRTVRKRLAAEIAARRRVERAFRKRGAEIPVSRRGPWETSLHGSSATASQKQVSRSVEK